MTHELILTSVAQGLDPKDHGFCPVGADAAVSPRVFDQLFELSHYRHLVSDPGKNPVAYSHLILPGRIEHVLSRTAVTGIDYQQQPNVLTHHIVLEGLELASEGPAWLLALPGFHFSEWNTPPVQFLLGRPIPTLTNPQSLTRRQLIARQRRWLDPQKMALTSTVDTESELYLESVQSNDAQIILAASPTTPCPAWKELTGDAGWGGVLAETVFSGQPVVIVYNYEQNILPLFLEALALLPPYSSWQTTFCTYYSGLPEMFPCQWKGVIAGSEEAKILMEDTNNWVFDISVPMKDALPGKYVDYARYGQEHMLPLDAEEHAVTLANADTKPYIEDAKHDTEKLEVPPDTPPDEIVSDVVPPTELSPKHISPFVSFLHRSSRTQFYFLYSIMFALVLFLIILVVDQVGNFGIFPTLQNKNHPSHPVPPDAPEEDTPSVLDHEAESALETPEPNDAERDSIRTIFETEKEKQKVPLLQFWESFDVPESLPLEFPQVTDDQIDIPAKKTFGELSPLQPFGAALELRFVPLFELPTMNVETRLLTDSLPNWGWQVEAIDVETDFSTPMFHFQLTEDGLEMDWQQEGLNNQHLYETILTSLGFLQLSVAETPETATQIPLFAPKKAEVMKASDLAELADTQPPEYVVELPFASDLWQRIFAEMNPARIILLDVWAEPAGNWVQMHSLEESEFSIEVRTSQQIGKQTESGETVFENMGIPFSVDASLERVLWKGDKYVDWLCTEDADIKSTKEDLGKTIEQLQIKVFEGDAGARTEREQHETELRALNLRLKEIESILEKLPEAYKEIVQNETWKFHYSVFLGCPKGDKTLLILTTEQ